MPHRKGCMEQKYPQTQNSCNKTLKQTKISIELDHFNTTATQRTEGHHSHRKTNNTKDATQAVTHKLDNTKQPRRTQSHNNTQHRNKPNAQAHAIRHKTEDTTNRQAQHSESHRGEIHKHNNRTHNAQAHTDEQQQTMTRT